MGRVIGREGGEGDELEGGEGDEEGDEGERVGRVMSWRVMRERGWGG